MFQMLRSPFMATFLKGGFGLLGLVALTWALQQDVRSPEYLRAQTATPGALTCWGDDYGYIPPAGSWTDVTASFGGAACAIRATDRTVACWGDNDYGRANPPAGRFLKIDSGTMHVCGIKEDGSVACWGTNSKGESTPPAGRFIDIAAALQYSCGIKEDGTIVCWGDNANGQLNPPAGTFVQLTAEGSHGCALKADGTVLCWGKNTSGSTTPPAGTFRFIDAGYSYTCGIKTDETLKCWGYGGEGQTAAPTGTFSDVELGTQHACGLRKDGTIVCWGMNVAGMATPPSGTFSDLAVGLTHGCAIGGSAGNSSSSVPAADVASSSSQQSVNCSPCMTGGGCQTCAANGRLCAIWNDTGDDECLVSPLAGYTVCTCSVESSSSSSSSIKPPVSSSSEPTAVGQFQTSIIVQTSMESPKFVYSALVTIKNVSSTVAASAVIEVTTPKTLSLRPNSSDKNCKKAYTPSNTIIYGCAYVDSSSHAIPLNPGESKTFRIDFETSPKPAPFTIRAESKKFVGDGVIGSVAQWDWTCGNNTIDAGEQCDGSPTSCSGQSCTEICQCASVCGNGNLETGEQCETMAVAYEAGGAARNMVLGDFVGDSALDIAVLNTESLGVLPGKGDGTFDAYISTPVVGSMLLPLSLTPDMYAHDMDGDAKLDLVFATDDAIAFAKGNGNGTFNIQDLSLSAITGKIKRFAVGNFDTSGHPSLVLLTEPTADTPMEFWIYRGEAGMTFQSPTKIASASVGSSWSYFHSADFDGDGRQDVALVLHTGGGSTATNTLQIYYGNGDGTFTQKSFPMTTGHPKSVHDIADDGKLDFYVYDGNFPGGLGVDILLAQQNRTYVQSKLSFTSGNASYFTDVGDFNGDGKQDFYAGVLSQAIYYGNGSQNYTSASAYVRLPYNAMNSPKTLVADLNGDGNTDILSMENRYGGAATPSLIAVYLPSCTSPNVCSNTCNCAAPSVAPVSSSSSSSVSAGLTCGNAQVNDGEACDYAGADTCGSGKMCSGACSCIDCTPTGTPVTFGTKLGWTQASIPDVVKLDGTHALVAYYDKSSLMSMGMVRVAEINGSSVTLGPAVQFTGEAPTTLARVTPLIVFPVDSTHSIIAFTTSNTCKAVLATVTGNTVSVSSPTALFNRLGGCGIAFDGTTLTRRYNDRVIEKAVPTITGNQISWRFSEEDLFLNSTYDSVSIGAGKDLRLSAAAAPMTQRWPFLARLLARTLSDFRIGICNAGNSGSCECAGGSASCKQFPVPFFGGKIIPVGGNSYQVFTIGQGQWKVTPVTVNGNALTIGTPVALSSFSFGSAMSSIPAIAAGRFYVDVHGDLYGMEDYTGFLRMDVAPDGTVSRHDAPAGTFLTPLSYIRLYKGAGDAGMVQVTNQCTTVACIAEGQTGVTGGAAGCCAGLTQLSQRNVSAQNTCESQAGTFVCTRCGAAPLGDGQCGSGENRCNCAADCAGSSSSQVASCGNGIKEGSEQCEQGIACAAIDCFVAPCTQFQCNYETCRCFMPGSSSSTSATGISSSSSSSSSSSQVPAVCGNAAIEGTEECELGVCCHNGFSCDTRTCACTPLGQVPEQASTCGNYRIEAGEDCEDGITTPQLPCEGTATCNVHTCRCPGGMARCARWRSTP